MLSWFARAKKASGWLAISLADDAVGYAHGVAAAGGKAGIRMYGTHALEEAAGAQRAGRELHADRYRCATLLSPGDYQLLLVEAPNVPRAEMKSAMRWRLKEMIDYAVEDATLDVLEIPSEDASARARMAFAVVARNDVIRARMQRFEDAGIPLEVIDIPEIGQRNIAALHEESDRGVAMLYFGEASALLTINFRGELHLGRWLDVGLDQLGDDDERRREESRERVVLEFQRTLDHFERQFRNVPVTRLLVAPLPTETGLVAYLSANLGLQVEAVDLRRVIDFAADATPDEVTQWRLFHHFGAALRLEGKAS